MSPSPDERGWRAPSLDEIRAMSWAELTVLRPILRAHVGRMLAALTDGQFSDADAKARCKRTKSIYDRRLALVNLRLSALGAQGIMGPAVGSPKTVATFRSAGIGLKDTARLLGLCQQLAEAVGAFLRDDDDTEETYVALEQAYAAIAPLMDAGAEAAA